MDTKQANPCGRRQVELSLRVALVYNPKAGNFRQDDIARLGAAFARRGSAVSCHDSLSFRLDALAPRPDLVCISGGDGTVRTVMNANGQAAHDTSFCIHPTGTINLIAREVGYPSDPENLAKAMTGQRPARLHYGGDVDGHSFLCCATVGPDSRAVAGVSPALKARWGGLAYAIAFGRLLWNWPRDQVAVTIDGDTLRGEAVMIFKGRYYAGPWVLDDKADITSDQFRVLVMPSARRRDYARLILSALLGQALADPRWHRRSARQVALASSRPVPIQADGDVIATTPASVTIAPRPLHFL